jgi:electron transport complex protein RnfG
MSENVSSEPGYIRQAWLVILLAICYGGALAGVETTLGPKIAENKKNETYDKIPDLVPGADKQKTVEVTVEDATGDSQRVYKAIAADGRQLGWVLPAGGQGFADRIELLIGLDAQATRITGLYVLDQKETPGLGDYISGIDFQSRFQGAPTAEPLIAVKGDPAAPNEIRAITGATISSESVAAIVNRAVADFKEPIRQLAGDER